MNILITGGAGFIGSNLVDYHLGRGHKIHAIDDLSTGSGAITAAGNYWIVAGGARLVRRF